jgi:hypothetical protein
MAKETKARAPKNGNLGTFVDAVTPVPTEITENYLQVNVLCLTLQGLPTEQQQLINQMVDIAISCNKQEEFMSYGERIVINSLKKLGILV